MLKLFKNLFKNNKKGETRKTKVYIIDIYRLSRESNCTFFEKRITIPANIGRQQALDRAKYAYYVYPEIVGIDFI